MARLRIQWVSRDHVAPKAAATGETVGEEGAEAAKARDSLRAERPMMVYVTDDDPTNSIARKLEGVVFANEKVGIGSKFFECVKVSAGNALQDRILKDAGRLTPRIVFVQRDWTVNGVLEAKRISSGKLVKAMKAAARADYENKFEAMIRDYVKLLNDLDRFEAKKTQIADAKNRLASKPNASKAKKLEREERAFEKDMAEWQAKEKKLLTFRRKGDEKAQA
jgi:hypothetical protein